MEATEARLKFLNEAAHLLAIPSPAISATFGAARGRMLETNDIDLDMPQKEWDAIRREFCGACGNLMVHGWSCEVIRNLESKRMVKDKKEDTLKQSKSKSKDMIFSCLRCNRSTVQMLPKRASRHSRRAFRTHKAQAAASADDMVREDKSSVLKSANAGSKKRAKARKGGLQAMLAQSKTQISEQKGLDLMDFMK